MRRPNRLFLGIALIPALLLAPPGLVYSQVQPPQAVNQQDEVVTVHLAPDQGPDDVLQILRSGDKFETNNYVTQAFEIFNTDAYEMLLFMREAVAAEKGTVRSAKTQPPDGSPSRHFLMITTTPEHMASMEQVVRAFDLPGFVNSQGNSRRALRLQHRLASELALALQRTRLSGLNRVYADDLTNTLYYDDSPYVMQAVEDYTRFFDVPTPQIEFDVRIIEVREDDAKKVGLDWDAWKRSIGGQIGFTGNSFEGGANFGRIDSLLTLDATVLANFLNYSVQNGSANLVQRSRLTASNLDPAIISESKRVPHFDYHRTERPAALLTEVNRRVDAAGEAENREDIPLEDPRTVTIVAPIHNVRVDLGREEEGLLITIQPVIGTESVSVRTAIAVNTFNGLDQQDRPIIASQRLTNRFTLKNRESLLLGTIEREGRVTSRRGIPGLMSLPVLKNIFSVESARQTRSRLFIIATPTYSNVGYGAREIKELKDKPPLILDVRETQMEDGQTRETLDQIPSYRTTR